MKGNKKVRLEPRKKKHLRVRKKISGTQERPRLTLHRSNKHIFAQIIDDSKSGSLLTLGSHAKEFKDFKPEQSGKIPVCFEVGKRLAKRAVEKGIKEVVFDRSGYQYHGRIRALAEGAREGGLIF